MGSRLVPQRKSPGWLDTMWRSNRPQIRFWSQLYLASRTDFRLLPGDTAAAPAVLVFMQKSGQKVGSCALQHCLSYPHRDYGASDEQEPAVPERPCHAARLNQLGRK